MNGYTCTEAKSDPVKLLIHPAHMNPVQYGHDSTYYPKFGELLPEQTHSEMFQKHINELYDDETAFTYGVERGRLGDYFKELPVAMPSSRNGDFVAT